MAVHYSPQPAPPPSRPIDPDGGPTFWTWLALLFGLIGVAGSLFLTLDMGQIPCPLCFYQRTLILALTAVLLMGVVAGSGRSGLLSVITLPLTVAGLGIAGYHAYIEREGEITCPPNGALYKLYQDFRGNDDFLKKVEGEVTAPRESLAIFVLIFLTQFLDLLRSGGKGGFGLGGLIPALLVGGLLGAGLWFTAKDPRDITKLKDNTYNGCVREKDKEKLEQEIKKAR
jgi:disulfide bond formation protein DsbB